MMWDILTELKLAARSLAKRPGYAAVAALTLALGIGATVAIFTVVNAVVLRPLPYPGADRIVAIRHHAPGLNLPELQSSPGLIEHYREGARTLALVTGYEMRERNVTGIGSPQRVRAVAVTPEIFDVLAVRPERGRLFQQADAQREAPLVTILTHAMWQSHFGSDPDILGHQVELDGQQAQIVGVMPAQFVFPDPETRLLIPLWLDPERGFGAFGTRVLARLAPGVTLDRAQQEVHDLQRRIPDRFPDITPALLERFGWSVTVQPLRDDIIRDVSRPLWLLFGAVGLVLLVAGANVANLFLVRAESRQREVAVRSALGASRARIAGTFLAESIGLSLAGGAAGSLMAAAGIRVLVARGPAELPRLHEVSVDGAVLLFTAALILLSGLVLGAVPVLSSGRRSLTTLLRDGGRGNTSGRDPHRVRRLLIVGQVAAALVLLVASGLILRSVVRLYSVNPGFSSKGLLTAGVSLGTGANRVRASMFYQRVLDEVGAIPGVVSVGATTSLPIEANNLNGSNFAVQSRPRADDAIPPVAMYNAVTAGYFETLMMPLVAGRTPVRADAEQGRPVAWVNETFARRFLDNHAVGERIQIGEDKTWLEIVGVVGDVRTFGLREDIRPMVYLPLNTSVPAVKLDVVHIVARTRGEPASLVSALRAAVTRVNPSVPLTAARTMDEIVASSLARLSFTLTLLVIAAAVALVLGVVGLYGVISYIVTRRTSEIGVRLALGAQPGDVRAMILRQGLSVALVGVAVGLIAASALANLLASLLFEISARDPVTFGAVALVVTSVSALASYVPARRAAGIDPARALREEG
jgi:putative ABC transport system permease protein